MRPTLDELKNFWLLAYSRSALIQADGWAQDMENSDPKSSIHRALIHALIVSYARPFTQSQVTTSQRIVSLAGVEPPKALALTHNNLVSLRNKVIGHADALPAKGHAETPNRVLIFRDTAGFNLHTVLTADIGAEERKNVRQLCRHFIGHCDDKLNALIARFGTDLPTSLGVYEVLMTEAPEEWFKLVNTNEWRAAI
jgi:hypothetical protein